jgi:hypothetical protein
MLQIELTDFVLKPELALEDRESAYLCVRGYRVWVSDIRLIENPDRTLPKNCSKGCLYVDDVYAKCCTPINRLDEIYLIKWLPEDYNEGPTNQEKREMRLAQRDTAETLKSIFRSNPKAVLDTLDRKDIEAYLKT